MSESFKQLDNRGESQASPKTAPVRDWRFSLKMGLSICLAFGLSISLALPAMRGVRKALEPSLGSVVAFLLGFGVAWGVGAVVGLAVSWLVKPGRRERRPLNAAEEIRW
jgi:hypothetical protein